MALTVAAALALGGCVPVFARGGDVPYVQTPDRVVHEMLALAAVRNDDVVYDLGAGDGRIVIAAARWYGARAPHFPRRCATGTCGWTPPAGRSPGRARNWR